MFRLQKVPKEDQISIKEVYERTVALEAKLDAGYRDNKESIKHFRFLTIVIIILEIANLFVHAMI